MFSQSEPSREEIQTALNVVLRDMLCPGAALLTIAHLFFALGHRLYLTAEAVGKVIALDLATSLIGLGFWVYFARVMVSPVNAHRLAGLMIGVILTNFALQTVVVSNPNLPVHMLVLIIGAGCFLMSWGWLCATILASVAVWVEWIVLHPDAHDWRFAHILLVGVMLSLVVHWIRRKTYGDYERVKFQLRLATRLLEERLKFEHVLTKCSARLLASSGEEIDQTLREAITAVGEWLEIDHVCICRVEGTPPAFRMMQEWCGPDVAPKKVLLPEVTTASLPWCWERLDAGQTVQIRCLDELDDIAPIDKTSLAENSIRSLFAVPLASHGRTWGVLVLTTEQREVEWSVDTARLLRVLGEIILAAVHRKEAEIEISHLNHQLEQASKLVGLGEMAASLAHDLSNGVSSILQFGQGASRREERGTLTLEKCRECLADIGEQAQSMRDILRTILEFVRTRTCRKVPVQLADLFGQSELLLRGKLRQKSIEVRFAPPADLPPLWVDPSQITIVLVNLLLNSAQAMAEIDREKRTIAATVIGDDSTFIEISLRDNGPGIPEELREKVFEKFYTTKSDGLGLGLAFSRLYIEQHGGRLWCHPASEPGCEMRFTLPIAPGGKECPETPAGQIRNPNVEIRNKS